MCSSVPRFVRFRQVCLSSLLMAGISLLSPGMAASSPRSLQAGISLHVKVLLQGPYVAATGLMRDDLRAAGLLPDLQPYQATPFQYAGTETLNKALAPIVVGGDANAVVDWVLLDVRSAADQHIILASKAVLVQADGDLMDAETGELTLGFPALAFGDYVIGVRHRNHLGVMTAAAIPFTASAMAVDFSAPGTETAGGANARLLQNGVALLWGGDASQDQRVISDGAGNDKNILLGEVLTAPGNPGLNANYRLSGYWATDLNLDGDSLYGGPGNDANLLQGNILLHLGNVSVASNYIINGGLHH